MKFFSLLLFSLNITFPAIASSISSIDDLKAEQVILRPIWRAKSTPNDYFSSNNYQEIKNYTNIEQVYYIPNDVKEHRNGPVYRLYDGYKHMDSLYQAEASYTSEGILGYAWTSIAPAGSTEMYRVYNASNGDHAIASPGAPLAGFTKSEFFHNHHAYPRYASSTNTIECINGVAVKLCSNKRAGGTVWSLSWNGMNFVNVLDYGRQIQSSLGQISNYGSLPTEGGDNANAHLNPVYWHGSPVSLFETINKTQKTRAIPLEWNFSFFGGNEHRPIIYPNWRLGKDVYLDSQDLNLGTNFSYLIPQIVIYDTIAEFPKQLGNQSWQPSIEIPTGYVNNGPGNLNRFFTIDASIENLNAALTEIGTSHFSEPEIGTFHYQSDVQAGGVVIANDHLSHAIGIYSKRIQNNFPDENGYVYFTLWKFGSTNKWSAAYKGILNEGENKFRTYILVGTLDDVRVMMRQLFVMGY